MFYKGKLSKIKIHHIIISAFVLIFIFLQNNNSETDAYAYAISVKTGQNLLYPHHLLFCLHARFWFIVLTEIGLNIDAIFLLKVTNSIAAGVSLWFLFKILKLFNSSNILSILIFTGSCYGFIRFSTEAETYILPIMFSLISTYFFALFINKNQNISLLYSGLFFGISILFHQIHLFWFLGFLISLFTIISDKKIKKILTFALPCLVLVFVVYLFASANSNTQLIKYIFNDYYKGRANAVIGFDNFIMLPISLTRTIIQVHGYMFSIVLKFHFLIAFCIVISAFAAYLGYKFFKTISIKPNNDSTFKKAILITFILHFLFAFFSVGNAEFMVMLPILAVIWIDLKFSFNSKLLFYISLVIFIWNLIFGLIPLHFADIDGSKNLYIKAKKHKNEYWIFYNPQKMENISEYYLGKNSKTKYLRLDSLDLATRKANLNYVLTDHFNINEGLNRRKLLFKHDYNYSKLKASKRLKVDSFNFSFGEKYIYKVYLK